VMDGTAQLGIMLQSKDTK